MTDVVLPTPILPDGERLRTYFFWSFWVGVAFFGVYPAMNWITSLRTNPLHLYLPLELRIPFIPQFIWAYLSMYVLFLMPPLFIPAANMPALGKQLIAGSLVSAVVFLILPAELGFVRVVPPRAPYAVIFTSVFGVDRPCNLVPSLHVIYSSAIVLACADFARPALRAGLLLWLVVIVASTVFVHQHHLLDVAAALAIVYILRRRYEVTR
jgi:membrane-associated phospholipid phosphatase